MIIPEVVPEHSLFRPDEVSVLFSVRNAKIYEWIKYGKIRAVKKGGTVRIPRDAILEFIPTAGKGFLYSGKDVTTNRMVMRLRSRINNILKGKVKHKSTMEFIGCTSEELRSHIESQFKPDMTFENYGKFGWVIDHVIPCAQFDLSRVDHQKLCFHYTNLQPLWSIDNMKKGKKCTRSNIRQVVAAII